MNPPNDEARLDQDLVDFLTSHLAIHVAACNLQRQPTLVKAVGCRVNESRNKITVLIARSQSEALLRAIASNPRVAVVFCQPESHRTIQLKGTDIVVNEANEEDRSLIGPYQKTIAERLGHYGVAEIFSHTLYSCEAEDLVTLSFTPETAFRQTPGDHAGDKMRLGAPLP